MKELVLHFGQYKGIHLSKIPTEYLWWCSHQKWCPDSVFDELNRRGGAIIKEGSLRNAKKKRARRKISRSRLRSKKRKVQRV